MAEPPVLTYPDYFKPFVLYTDASDVGILQKQEDKTRIIRYLSKTLNPDERNYSSPERECIAIVHSVKLLKLCLLTRNFAVMSGHRAFLTLKQNANFKSRLMRWHLALPQFTFGIKHVKGEQILGKILSRIDLSDLESKSLEYSLESDFDAFGIGFLSVALTEEQESEGKELFRVLFLVLQDADALKTLSFDKITKDKG